MEPKSNKSTIKITKTHTGGLPANIGFPGFKQFPNPNTYPTTKSKVEKVRTIRKRG